MLKVPYHHAKFSVAQILPAAGMAKYAEFFACVFVCVYVTLANNGI